MDVERFRSYLLLLARLRGFLRHRQYDGDHDGQKRSVERAVRHDSGLGRRQQQDDRRSKESGYTGRHVDPEFRRADGKRVRMGGGGDNILVFTDAATNKVLGLIQAIGGKGPTAISPDGALLVTAGGRAQQLWDLAACKPIGPPQKPAAAVAFSPDGKTILTGSRDGTAHLRSMPPVVEGTLDRVRPVG